MALAGAIASDAAIAGTDLAADESWSVFSLNVQDIGHFWASYDAYTSSGGTFATPEYKKDQFGRVRLRGLLTEIGHSGFTYWYLPTGLPSGYMPSRTAIFGVPCGGGLARVDCRSDGYLDVQYSPSTNFSYLSLDEIYFHTDPTPVALGPQLSNAGLEVKWFTTNSWTNVTFTSGKTLIHYGGDATTGTGYFYDVQYVKDAMGHVHLRGVLQNTTKQTLPFTLFTLPSGYRPASNLLFTTVGNNAWADIIVQSDGQVLWNGGSNSDGGWLPLDGIGFAT